MPIRDIIVYHYLVVCDGCDAQHKDGVLASEDQDDVEQMAADDGWLIFTDADTEPNDWESRRSVLCPQCVERCLPGDLLVREWPGGAE